MMKLYIGIFALFVKVQFFQGLVIRRNAEEFKLVQLRLKKDVTVVTTRAGDPCPTVVDSNRVVGFGFNVGPSVSTNLYAQGQRQVPATGFKSWGGNLGANDVGFKLPFGLGIPIGSKVLNGANSGCMQTNPVQQFPSNPNPQNSWPQPPAQPVNQPQPFQPDPNFSNSQVQPNNPFANSQFPGNQQPNPGFQQGPAVNNGGTSVQSVPANNWLPNPQFNGFNG